MSKLNFDVKDGSLKVGVDSNEDGQNSLDLELSLSEAVGEALSRGEAVEGAKLVELKFELTTLVLKVDTDKDGEKLLDLKVDLGEAADEIKSLFIKKEE